MNCTAAFQEWTENVDASFDGHLIVIYRIMIMLTDTNYVIFLY